MSNTVVLKRSAVQGKIPLVSDLSLGELAINTYDGILYTLQNNGTAKVVPLGGNYVDLSSAQTIGGTKTFSTTPLVGTMTPGDNTTAAASTAFVQQIMSTNTVNVAGGSNVTLSSAQYSGFTIILTGALTANISIIFPVTSNQWNVVNNTSGSYTITCKPTSGTGVLITQGKSCQIYCDGTNINYSNSDPLGSGAILQALYSTIAAASGTTYKAVSNVVPLSTDGTQIWSQAITPTTSTSDVAIQGTVYADHGSNARKITLAIFRGTTCIGVSCDYVASTAKGVMIPFTIRDTPGVMTTQTYTIRCFADNTGTWYINQGSSPLYGGVLVNDVIVMEIA